MSAERHPSDERLLDLCLDATHDPRGGRPDDREHVDACPVCQGRLTGLEELLGDASDVIAAQADVIFSPERLARQRARILQRIEPETASGRVISFPAAQVQPRRPQPRSSARWIAGAAAAGLLIGMLAGHLAHAIPGRAAQQVPAVAASSEFQTDEEFLSQLETAIEGERGVVLGPLDDMTPRVWEVAAQ